MPQTMLPIDMALGDTPRRASAPARRWKTRQPRTAIGRLSTTSQDCSTMTAAPSRGHLPTIPQALAFALISQHRSAHEHFDRLPTIFRTYSDQRGWSGTVLSLLAANDSQ